jgi:LysM repeat protein
VPAGEQVASAALPPQPEEYVVQAGDTLSAIAASAGTSVQSLQTLNNLDDPNNLFVGQVLLLPAPPEATGSSFRILPDSRLVRAPGSGAFDVDGFIAAQPGFIRTATDRVDDNILTAAQIVRRVSLEYSVDARLLLALLEYRGGWLTDPNPIEQVKTYPLGAPASPLGFDRNGLYRQLTWGADNLNRGYYTWKQGRLDTLEFTDGARIRLSPEINAATAGVQYMLSLYSDYPTWVRSVAVDGLFGIYQQLMGDPNEGALAVVVAPDIEQPEMVFPFPQGETWFFTGGPHGGWGSGSAWAAIDFAPPDDLTAKTTACYISDFFATALAPGVVVRTDTGTVVVDLDMPTGTADGDETTGWTVLYLHIAARDRIAPGTRVQVGDRIGRPSCEGGFSTGTHMHIARRYNGEWIPAACDTCREPRPPFVMSGWSVAGLPNQEYQGYLVRGGDRRIAEQGRNVAENQVTW